LITLPKVHEFNGGLAVKGRGIAVLAVLGVLAATALLAGCGSDSSSNAGATATSADGTTEATTTSSKPLTKKEFVDQASEICQAGLKKKDDNVTAALKTLPPSPTGVGKKAAGKLVELAVLPVYTEIIEELDQLTPPKGDEAEVTLIVTKYEAAMQGAEDDPASAVKTNPFEAGDRAAEAYGITNCIL